MPRSKSTELCSSVAVIPQSKSTEMWSSAAPFHHDLWFFRHWTNEHFSSKLFIRKNMTSAQSRHSSHWNQYNRPNYWKGYWREPQTHIPLKALMIPFKRVKLSASNGLNFSSGLHEEFPIKIKLMIPFKTLSTFCFLTVPRPGCSKLG